MIDVIIPVYRGLAQTRRCIDSVMASRVATPHEVIVIDDASPEPAMSAWLATLAAAGRITLLTHAANQGFVASVNEGMALHGERDVVLLNSDTEVADGWLDRLAACAAREPNIATVTPLSNNATICSYPNYPEGGPMPEGWSTHALAALCAEANAGSSVEIPTGVGFCLYIRRACLDDIGLFDVLTFGAGYGEEVDFCLRAVRSGWQHRLAADVFVQHEGSVSFTPEVAGPRKLEAQRTIDARFPGFQQTLAAFFQQDPARASRRQLGLACLRASETPKLLFLTHGWGGGVARHIDDLVSLIGTRAHVLLLRPGHAGGPEGIRLTLANGNDGWDAFFPLPDGWDSLLATLRGMGISRVHLHHTHGLPEKALTLAEALGVPLDVTLHDYLTICPQNNLADKAGRYCGEPDAAGCNRCLADRPHAWGVDITAWRQRWSALLRGASRTWAPSNDLRQRVGRYHPDAAVALMPHPEVPRPSPIQPARVLVLGGLGPMKGLQLVADCANDAAQRGLPLFFRVLGHVGSPVPQWPDSMLSTTGSYPEGHLPDLIAIEQGDVALFPSLVPESYSYTLSAAIASGLPIVALAHGAFVERLAGYPHATLLPLSSTTADINAALLSLSGRSPAP